MAEYYPYSSPLGPMLIKTEGEYLCGLWFEGQKYFPDVSPEEICRCPNADANRVSDWLNRYFAGLCPEISELKLNPSGTEFQRRVWAKLCGIPYGETTTYGCIAGALEAAQGRRMSAQAVGGAVGRNPISVIIPCHRVLGADGALTGYAGGLERKQALLRHESGIASAFYYTELE